jgi:hypothetical protein
LGSNLLDFVEGKTLDNLPTKPIVRKNPKNIESRASKKYLRLHESELPSDDKLPIISHNEAKDDETKGNVSKFSDSEVKNDNDREYKDIIQSDMKESRLVEPDDNHDTPTNKSGHNLVPYFNDIKEISEDQKMDKSDTQSVPDLQSVSRTSSFRSSKSALHTNHLGEKDSFFSSTSVFSRLRRNRLMSNEDENDLSNTDSFVNTNKLDQPARVIIENAKVGSKEAWNQTQLAGT